VEDIILITGRDLTKRWAIATFTETARDAGVSFNVGDAVGVGAWGSWTSNVQVPLHDGPTSSDPSAPDGNVNRLIRDTADLPLRGSPPPLKDLNQCNFLRGFRVVERRFPRSAKAVKIEEAHIVRP
jgi:hypothetical protein